MSEKVLKCHKMGFRIFNVPQIVLKKFQRGFIMFLRVLKSLTFGSPKNVEKFGKVVKRLN